jgi:ferredoxin
LLPHIVNTRIAHVFFSVNDTYLYELARLWPDRAFLQSLLLVLVWSHGCIGLHYWLRLSDGYETARPILWTIAAAVPVLGIAGFAVSGQLTAEIIRDPQSLAQLKERSNWPNATDGAIMAQLRDLAQYLFGALLLTLAGIYALRRRASRARNGVSVNYRDGPTVDAMSGMTLLEISRASGVPHASVCGGRGRCFTCRVKIDSGLVELPAPNPTEAIALRVMEAPEDVRLACQLRPCAPLTVTILNRPAVPGPFQVEFIEVKSVVAAHARAVLANEIAEIETADPVTVARWFTGKFPFPIIVPNLSPAGFSLRGARVDYLQDRPVPALVFARNGQTISLYLVPSKDSDAFAVRGNRTGYSVIGWSDADFAYFAASDIDRRVLDALQDACRDAGAFVARDPTVEQV